MGNRNVRLKAVDLANYGAGYDPYYNYGEIENYGSLYQPIGGEYPFGYGITDGPLITSMKPPLGGVGAFGQQGLLRYGNIYPAGFNPVLQPGLSGPKVRLIYVPNNVVNGFQNLLQQSGVSGGNPLIGGIGGINPLASGVGGMNPLMGGIGGINPLAGGVGGMNPLMGGVGGMNPFMGGIGGINPLAGGVGGMNPLMGGIGGINPLAGGVGGMNPLMGGVSGMNPLMGGIGGINPLAGGVGGMNPLIGGMGGYGIPQMMPQGPYASPFLPQMPLPQMGSNCCSISLQLPSVASQIPYPIPCPPPMIQPVMPQMPFRKIILYLLLSN
jgi:hypothetical protein